MLQRASASGVETLVAFTTDFEKAEALVRLAKENSSVIYAMVRQGIGWTRGIYVVIASFPTQTCYDHEGGNPHRHDKAKLGQDLSTEA